MFRRILALVGATFVLHAAAAATTDPLNVNAALGLNKGHTPSAATAPAAQAPTTKAPDSAARPVLSPVNASNLHSDVFGAQLFTGSFAREGAAQFNPDYVVASGDTVQIRLWGAFEFDAALTVDPQGNIFLPHVGPVRLRGVRNADLEKVIDGAVRRVFRSNVMSYASIAAAQPVRVFVSGFVQRPGQYSGTSMDSLLHYIDQAGGIDTERGSFIDIKVKRGAQVRATVNLYDFLLAGEIAPVQLADGDVIFVAPRKNTVRVSGLAENAKVFEFAEGSRTVSELMKLAKPRAVATHVRVVRNSGAIKNVEYFPLEEATSVTLGNGDELEFTADKKPGTITVRIEGEHQGPQEFVLPYGARLGELVGRIQYSERSDSASLQLFRSSVRDRQKQMLATALKSLESSVLTARSGTSDEARLRKDEAELVLQWVDRAKSVEPSGQVLVAQAAQRNELLLENGDVLRIPARDGLVLISGEVLFPNAIAFDPGMQLEDYVRRAGGYAQNADTSRIVVAHRDGSFEDPSSNGRFFGRNSGEGIVRAGDEILVLPKVDVKSREITKDLAQILYQIAVSAKVVLGL